MIKTIVVGALSCFAMATTLVLATPLLETDRTSNPTQRIDSILEALQPRALGPTVFGGRVSNIAVVESDPRIFYVAAASGGLWKTVNGGMTFTPIFDRERTVALGVVRVNQANPDIIWLGTGEQNNRNSSSWGDGVYKSTDGGETWTNMGLRETRHIGSILLHPTNPDIVYVGALGHLWGENDERGLYKTTNGGQTWERVLFVDSKTGVIDMVMDPRDPNKFVVAMYERMRYPYRWESGGPGSGLYKTEDGGATWTRPTGLPDTDIGRIGLNVFLGNPDVLVATVENREAGGVYKSRDNGASWERINSLNPRPFYFSKLAVDPKDENRMYVLGVQFHFSDDAGETFRNMTMAIHVDHHAIWINPNDPNHIINGNDGGVAQTRDRGLTWEHINNLPIGQFYAVGYDMRKPYYVYGGLQDNGSWGGPTQHNRGSVNYSDWYLVSGGDGFYVEVDPTDWRTVYSESQGGALRRLNQQTGEVRGIRPQPPQGERYRFNWNSPVQISPHNSSTIYFGGNKLFKSINKGDDWQILSDDLSYAEEEKLNPRGGVTPEDTGAERYGTITTLAESPVARGLLWVGTDDGRLWVTRDDGANWTETTSNLPDVPMYTYVSRVHPSAHVEGRCYVTLDGHRNNDYQPYVFVTEDFGQTWIDLANGLIEDESSYVIREGRLNPNLLILGTELSLYFSLDRGQTWTRYETADYPTVRVDDIKIHPRELDVIVATHGRSFYIIPGAPLEQLTPSALEESVFLCKPSNVYLLGFRPGSWFGGDRVWSSPNTQPAGYIYYHLKDAQEGRAEVQILNSEGTVVGELNGNANAGLNMIRWLPTGRNAVPAGTYTIKLTVGGIEKETMITVEDVSDRD